MWRILLIEDDPVVCRALVRELSSVAELRIEAAQTLQDGLFKAREETFDAALIDIGLPDGDGLEAVRALAELGVPSLVLTVFDDRHTIARAVGAGAMGYILKDQQPEEMRGALMAVVRGESTFSPRVARQVLRMARPAVDERLDRLTPRERELLAGLARGLTYGECAKMMGIGKGTVQTYVKQLYRKLEVVTKAEASALAVHCGLVDPS